PPPWIRGDDILALGIPQGPRVGYWHKKAYEAQLESRFPDREALLNWIREEIREQPGGGVPAGPTPGQS
ncbi:MAG TPA: hypothetical protein PK634_12225, partial [Kiritimatiellia bacterium]|nr:hypothetical protein [Kiritimatiellia bacterium]